MPITIDVNWAKRGAEHLLLLNRVEILEKKVESLEARMASGLIKQGELAREHIGRIAKTEVNHALKNGVEITLKDVG